MREELRVPVEKLRRVFDPNNFVFADTSAVEPAEGLIGQEKAVQALMDGLGVENTAYNIYAAADGISRNSALLKFIRKYAAEKLAAAAGKLNLRDFCCIANIERPDQPKILIFKKGGGREFKNDIWNLSEELRKGIVLVSQSEECAKHRNRILEEYKERIKQLQEELDGNLEKEGFMLRSAPTGGAELCPLSRGASPKKNAMGPDEYNALPKEEKDKISKTERDLIPKTDEAFAKIHDLQKEAQGKIEKSESRFIKEFIERTLKKLRKKYASRPEVLNYFEGLKKYVLGNVNLFREEREMAPNGNGADPFLPFKVNILVDNSDAKEIPVIFEANPNFDTLFGRMERNFVHGVLLTDHSRIKAGSLALADGGYLVLDILDVLKNNSINPVIWEKLKKTLRYGFLKIEEPMSFLGLAPTKLDLEPMPVSLKVVLVGDPIFYRWLFQNDSDFPEIFKIKAEFDDEMPLTPENEMAYAGFISLCAALPFDRSAVAKIQEYGLRLSGNQTKLSTQFNRIKDLIIEAGYWAEKTGSAAVNAEHVQKALERQRSRANLYEEKLQEYITDGMFLVDTDGDKVGQINALSVYDLGDYSFGKPSRITVNTFCGKAGVVSIEREVKMSGPIHNKGVKILSGYFGKKYGQDKPLSFSASICFEQNYEGIEGDSASAAELICLISSLSTMPIRQNLAMTGSVDQKGEIQPIGGVNEKIEGFFDVCQSKGPTNNQGVIIPRLNVQHLMLREDVVEACRDGRFHIYAILTIDEGLEILMGQPAADVHRGVEIRLSAMTKILNIKKEVAE